MTFSNRGNNSYSGGRNNARPELFDAICAQCGSACKVPFRPNGRKEVFCSKCFENNNGGGSREPNFGDSRRPKMYDSRDGSNFADKQMFRATCDQCGQGCEVPFRPTGGKPVLCSNCFAATKSDGGRVPRKDNSSELAAISAKLDKILKLLTPKILEEIETNLEKTPSVGKKRTKKVANK